MGRDGAARPRAWLGLGLGWACCGLWGCWRFENGGTRRHRAQGSWVQCGACGGRAAGRAGFAKDRPWGFAAATMTWARVAMWLDGCDGLDGGLEGLSCSCLRAETQDASCAETAERIDQIPRGSNAEILLVVYSQPGDPWMLLHETDPLALAWPDRALDYFDGAAHHAPSLNVSCCGGRVPCLASQLHWRQLQQHLPPGPGLESAFWEGRAGCLSTWKVRSGCLQ